MDLKTLAQSIGHQLLQEVVQVFFQENAPSLVNLGRAEVEGVLKDVWYSYAPLPRADSLDGLNEEGWLFLETIIEDRALAAKTASKAMRIDAAETKKVRAAAISKLGSLVSIAGTALSGALISQIPKI